jgi:hypothetical protein
MKLNRPKLFEVIKIFSLRQWKSQSTTSDKNNQTKREKDNEFEMDNTHQTEQLKNDQNETLYCCV